MINKKIDDMKKNIVDMSANPSLVYGRIIQRKVSSLTKPHLFISVFLFYLYFSLVLSFQ